jgi:hypothetical protein
MHLGGETELVVKGQSNSTNQKQQQQHPLLIPVKITKDLLSALEKGDSTDLQLEFEDNIPIFIVDGQRIPLKPVGGDGKNIEFLYSQSGRILNHHGIYGPQIFLISIGLF